MLTIHLFKKPDSTSSSMLSMEFPIIGSIGKREARLKRLGKHYFEVSILPTKIHKDATIYADTFQELLPGLREQRKAIVEELDKLKTKYKELEEKIKAYPYDLSKLIETMEKGEKEEAIFRPMFSYLANLKMDLNSTSNLIDETKTKLNEVRKSISGLKEKIDQVLSQKTEIATARYFPFKWWEQELKATDIQLSTERKDPCHLNKKKILKYMQAHPLPDYRASNEEPTKAVSLEAARQIKNAILAGLSDKAKKLMIEAGAPSSLFKAGGSWDQPKDIEKWLGKFQRYMSLANGQKLESVKEGKQEEEPEQPRLKM